MARLAVIVLAAGQSSRFGTANKLCVQLGGVPLVRRVVATAIEAGVGDVIVVTGNDSSEIEAALDGLDVRLVHNGDWESGMGSSIATGIGALDEQTDGAFIVPGDMPFLTAEVVRSLRDVFVQNELHAIVFPATAAGEQRNPVLWPRRYFAELATLSGPHGAKSLLGGAGGVSVAVPFPDDTPFADIDSQDDLKTVEAR